MLTIVCDKYNTLQSRFAELMIQNKDKTNSNSTSPSKRKSLSSEQDDDEYDGNVCYGDHHAEGGVGDHYSCKRLKQVKPNVSTTFVRVDPSDKTTLVSSTFSYLIYLGFRSL